MRICSYAVCTDDDANAHEITRPPPSRRAPRTGCASADELDQVFDASRAISACCRSRTRLKILHAICNAERSVSAIVAATGATQTNVSRHLALMHQAGVVSRRRDGSAVYYRVADPEFVEICRTRLRAHRRPHRRAAAAEARPARVRRAALTLRRASHARSTPARKDGADARFDRRRDACDARRSRCRGAASCAARPRWAAARPPCAARAQRPPRAEDAPTTTCRPNVPAWSRTLGAPILASPYGVPSKYEANVAAPRRAPGSRARRTRRSRSRRCRTCSASSRRRACTSSAITPACPTIDPHQHRLMIHGLVRAAARSTRWTTSCAFRRCRASISSSAARTPAWSGGTSRCRRCSTRTACSAAASGPACRCRRCSTRSGVDRKRGALRARRRRRRRVADAHDPDRRWRSTTCSSCYGQNGEMLRPEQGYPLRLLVPGVQGVSSVKWLRRLEGRRRAVEHARGIAALRRPDARRHAPPVHVDPGSEERDHVAVRRPGAARPRLSRDHRPRVVGARQGAARRRVDRRRPQLAHRAAAGAGPTPRR